MNHQTRADLVDHILDVRAITAGCRDDMHEPDENGLEAFVWVNGQVHKGSLDNAMGDDPNGGEIVITLTRDHGLGTQEVYNINLATLIACTRLGPTTTDAGQPAPEEVTSTMVNGVRWLHHPEWTAPARAAYKLARMQGQSPTEARIEAYNTIRMLVPGFTVARDIADLCGEWYGRNTRG